MNNKENSYKGKIITIPNLLSLFRILLIPIIVWLYCVEKKYELTILVLLISGASDIIDGFIARRFNMISDIGKALDPIVDKLTQGVTLICLLIDFPRLAILLFGLLIKEFLLGIKELYSKSATTSSTGGLVLALKRAFLLLAQKGGIASTFTGPL